MQIINRGHSQDSGVPHIGADAIQTIILLPGATLAQRRASRPASQVFWGFPIFLMVFIVVMPCCNFEIIKSIDMEAIRI